jgi:hypothetical protein
MLKWLKAAQWLHGLVLFLAAIGFFRFLIRTRFWYPKYVHWLAAIALVIGVGLLFLLPADAPVNQGDWIGLKKAFTVLILPAIVYFAFVFYGGQRAAYEARQYGNAVRCPSCRAGTGVPGQACDVCGQIVPRADGNHEPTA